MRKSLILFVFLLSVIVSCNKIEWSDAFKKNKTENSVKNEEKRDAGTKKITISAEPDSGINRLSWLRYPSISPDGSEIAFAFMGDIYIVPSEGGFAHPITSSQTYESSPVWSNDGKTLAFTSNRFGNHDIFTISRDGGEVRRLTYHSANDTPMTFSPDNSKIYFSSPRIGSKESSVFPSRRMPQLYSISVEGGNENLELTVPVLSLKISKDGSKFIYHDNKGYEDEWRKHHTSGITRDIWQYEPGSRKFTKLSDFKGEERNPVFGENGEIFYLSEESGSFNVWKRGAAGQKTQISKFDTHPVRFLSRSENGTLCYTWDGEIYTQKEGEDPKKLDIYSTVERKTSEIRAMLSGQKDFSVSPDGSEAAVILRGEVYVVDIESGTTRRVTNTPNEERWVNFHPDGKKLLYSSFRNGSWNVYEASFNEETDPSFAFATEIKEKEMIANDSNTFQAYYSPDGKKIAYLSERTELRYYDTVKNLHKSLLPGDRNISYVDGDQQYSWAPDSSRIAVIFNGHSRWAGDLGIIDIESGEITNVTNTGTEDYVPKWSGNGEYIAWLSGNEIYAFFLNKKGLDNYRKSADEIAIEKKLEQKKKEKDAAKAAQKPQQKEEPKNPLKKPERVEFDKENTEERIVKLSLAPSKYVEIAPSKDGETLYFLSFDPSSFRIASIALREKKEKPLAALPHPYNLSFWDEPNFVLELDSANTSLFALANEASYKISLADKTPKPISPAAEFSVSKSDEYRYLLDYVWKTINDKFYDKDLHGVDWPKYRDAYAKFIPYINNNYDFTELLSELLGELNASHTGSGYIHMAQMADSTGRLGIFYSTDQRGLKIDEIIANGPLDSAKTQIKPGTYIEKIDGVATNAENIDKLLNRKAGKRVRISLLDTANFKRWDEIVKPTTYRGEYDLLYDRWVKRNRERVEKLSGGKLGYVHIRGMDGASFKTIFDQIMGRFNETEGIVIDTRFNGGGWLHDDLAVLFSGKSYTTYSHRGVKNFGGDPQKQWTKKSILIVSEGNYSDAHLFPYTYRTLGLGKIVGMPVAGTATAVWWPQLIDESIYFGIPQIGIHDTTGKYLENNELIPDYVVPFTPSQMIGGEDPQLEKAVQVLLEEKGGE